MANDRLNGKLARQLVELAIGHTYQGQKITRAIWACCVRLCSSGSQSNLADGNNSASQAAAVAAMARNKLAARLIWPNSTRWRENGGRI